MVLDGPGAQEVETAVRNPEEERMTEGDETGARGRVRSRYALGSGELGSQDFVKPIYKGGVGEGGGGVKICQPVTVTFGEGRELGTDLTRAEGHTQNVQ